MSVLDPQFLLHFGIPTDCSFADVALLEARWRSSDHERVITSNVSNEFDSTMSSAIEFPRTPCVRFEDNIGRGSRSSEDVPLPYDLSHSNMSVTRFEEQDDDDTAADFSRLSLKPFGEKENKGPLLKTSPDFFDLSSIGRSDIDDSRPFSDSLIVTPSIECPSISKNCEYASEEANPVILNAHYTVSAGVSPVVDPDHDGYLQSFFDNSEGSPSPFIQMKYSVLKPLGITTKASGKEKEEDSSTITSDLRNWISARRYSIVAYSSTNSAKIFDEILQALIPSLSSRKTDRKNPSALEGGILIVTSKNMIDTWASPIRAARGLYKETSLHVYTQPLVARRRMGPARIAGFDVVVTTFDILKAKEVAVPEESICDESAASTSEIQNPWLNLRRFSSRNISEYVVLLDYLSYSDLFILLLF